MRAKSIIQFLRACRDAIFLLAGCILFPCGCDFPLHFSDCGLRNPSRGIGLKQLPANVQSINGSAVNDGFYHQINISPSEILWGLEF
jgi:hypothetical protein